MRKINKIIIHCSDTPNFREHGAEDIHRWHTEQGWNMIGYHYVIKLDGNIEQGRPEWMQGAHCKGHNADSIGICLIGRDQYTTKQWFWLEDLVEQLKLKYPEATVHGHNEFSAKTCPNFDAQKTMS